MYILGIDPDRVTATSEHNVGSLGADSDGNIWQYVQADGTGCSAGDVVQINESNVIDQATTTTSAPGTGAGQPVGVAKVAFTASYYGWVQRNGIVAAINVASSCAVHTRVNTTGTAGRVDDDATSGAELVEGLTTTAAEASNAAAGVANWPYIGATL